MYNSKNFNISNDSNKYIIMLSILLVVFFIGIFVFIYFIYFSKVDNKDKKGQTKVLGVNYSV